MARAFFLLLLLLNLVVYIWRQGYLGPVGDELGREPGRLNEQLQVEKLRVTLPVEKPDTDSADTPPIASAATVASTPPVMPPPAPARLCRRIGPLPIATIERLQKVVQGKGGTANLVGMEDSTYWVYVPPAASREAADKKAQEIRQLGVSELFVVNEDGANRWAISLGLFHLETSAKDMLQQMTDKGVRGARIGIRKTKKSDRAMLDVAGTAEQLDAGLSGQAGKTIDCRQL